MLSPPFQSGDVINYNLLLFPAINDAVLPVNPLFRGCVNPRRLGSFAFSVPGQQCQHINRSIYHLMKKFISTAVIIFSIVAGGYAQIGLGITTPHPNAYFQINSTNKGVLLPRMTAAQRIAIAPEATANGLLVFDTDSSSYMFWTGAAWRKMDGDAGLWVKNGDHIYNSNTGRVGIGINTALARLHVADSCVLFTGSATEPDLYTTENPPLVTGTQMLWYPAKAAFRAGYVQNSEWSRDNTGSFSFATGYNCIAKGTNSFSAGKNNTVNGGSSVAIGESNMASGYSSVAIGNSNNAYADGAVAFGWVNRANAYALVAGDNSKADGIYSFALGHLATANGGFSIALGQEVVATGQYGMASGYLSEAIGVGSFARGYLAKAYGQYSTVFGNQSQVNNDNSFVNGLFNTCYGARSFVFGDNNGAAGNNALSFGSRCIADANFAIAMGDQAIVNSDYGVAIGYSVSAGPHAVSLGQQNSAWGNSSFAINANNHANALYSTATGYQTTANGNTSFTTGSGNFAFGNNSFVGGIGNNGKAWGSFTVGSYCDDMDYSDPELWSFTDRLFQVGNGNDLTRRNALTLLRNGNLGLGTVNPVALIHLQTSDYDKIILDGNDPNNNFGLGVASLYAMRIHAATGYNIELGTGSSNSFTSRLFVDGTTGNVGIGNTIPVSPLSFANTFGNKISLQGSDDLYQYGLGVQSGEMRIYSDNTVFGIGSATNFTEHVRIRFDGNVGIGNNNPAYKLDVRGRILLGSNGTETAGMWLNNVSNTFAPALVGMQDEHNVGFYGSYGAGWGLTMNTVTGQVTIADGTQAAGRILSCDAAGRASWVDNAAYNSSVSGVFAGGGVALTTSMGSAYMNTYIDLPPGKFIVMGTYLAAQGGSGGPMTSGQSMWIRTAFSSSAVSNITSADVVGGGMMSGSIGYSYPYAVINGQTIINNTSGATKRYYVWGNMSTSGGQPIGFALAGFGSNFWGENQLIAVPIN